MNKNRVDNGIYTWKCGTEIAWK